MGNDVVGRRFTNRQSLLPLRISSFQKNDRKSKPLFQVLLLSLMPQQLTSWKKWENLWIKNWHRTPTTFLCVYMLYNVKNCTNWKSSQVPFFSSEVCSHAESHRNSTTCEVGFASLHRLSFCFCLLVITTAQELLRQNPSSCDHVYVCFFKFAYICWWSSGVFIILSQAP